MKNFFKKIAVFLGIIAVVSVTISLTTPVSVSAECREFAGLKAWDCDMTTITNENQLVDNIALIATNILTDITVIASYLVLGYVIYGGYQYMFASGDTTKVAAGKKTLTHAFIGLAIVISAYAIFGAIRIALIGDKAFGSCEPIPSGGTGDCIDGGDLVTNLINWVCAMGGIVSVIFIIVGAWGYMTSAGDPNKLQKAKTTILYAIIGLAVVALSLVITAFVSNLVRDANGDSAAYIETTNTTKEVLNEKV